MDQGYSFKVVTELPDLVNVPDLHYTSKREQLEMLGKVLATDDREGEEEQQDDDPFARQQRAKNKKMAAQRRTGNAQALTGTGDRAYHEYDETTGGQAGTKKTRNPLFKQRAEQAKLDKRNQ